MKTIAEDWLKLHPGFRLATDQDCGCDDELASIRSPGPDAAPNYHPYYAMGDFNRDGVPDVAYGVIGRNAPGEFSILIVDGARTARGAKAETLLNGPFKLSAAALFFGPPASPRDQLMVGAFESDGGCDIVPRFWGGYRLRCGDE